MNNNQKIIIFKKGEKDPHDIIMEVLENNNLKENFEDFLNRIDKNQTTYFGVLYNLAKSLVKKEITEINFIESIKNQLNIPEKTAENILKEIKEKFSPLVLEIIDNNNEEENDGEEISYIEESKEINTKEDTPPSIKKTSTSRRIKKPKIIEEIETKPEELKQQKQPNKYREPIE